MKALEKKTVLTFDPVVDINQHYLYHRERMRAVTPIINNTTPTTWRSIIKASIQQRRPQANAQKEINRDNMILAENLMKIMEHGTNNSTITNKKQSSSSTHRFNPKTSNYKRRLDEATEIHNKNLTLANRLDKIQPILRTTYSNTITNNLPKLTFKNRINKCKIRAGINGNLHADTTITDTSLITTNFLQSLAILKNNTLHNYDQNTPQLQHQLKLSSSFYDIPPLYKEYTLVLLEYTKVQDQRLLDIVVLKDKKHTDLWYFIIFGVDLDDGKRPTISITAYYYIYIHSAVNSITLHIHMLYIMSVLYDYVYTSCYAYVYIV